MLSDESIEQTLKDLNFNGTLDALNKLTSNKKNDIRRFYTKNKNTKNSSNPFRKLLLDLSFHDKIITDEEACKLKGELRKISKENVIPLKLINVKSILSNLPEGKREILNEKNTEKFINREKSTFNLTKCINYIDDYVRKQGNISLMFSLENFDSTKTVSVETLKKFIAIKANELCKDKDKKWINETFVPFVTYRLLFELGKTDSERISVPILFASDIFNEFIEQDETSGSEVLVSLVEERVNQFSKKSDQKTHLIPQENIKDIYGFSFTDSFIDILYNNIETQNGQATFQGFFTFLFSLMYIDTNTESVKFFFKMLDIDGDGVLGKDDIYYFYKSQVKEACKANIKSDFNVFYSNLTDTCVSKNEDLTEEAIIKADKAKDVIFALIDNITFREMFITSEATAINDDDDDLFEEEDI